MDGMRGINEQYQHVHGYDHIHAGLIQFQIIQGIVIVVLQWIMKNSNSVSTVIVFSTFDFYCSYCNYTYRIQSCLVPSDNAKIPTSRSSLPGNSNSNRQIVVHSDYSDIVNNHERLTSESQGVCVHKQ